MQSKRLATIVAAAAAVAAMPAAAEAAKVETVATGLDNPRGVALGPGGGVYVANAGAGGSQCTGEGESQQCFGETGSVVRVSPSGRKRVVAGGILSSSGPGGLFAAGLHGVSVDPAGRIFGVMTSGPPSVIKGLPRQARAVVGRLFRFGAGSPKPVARIDRVEWRRNIDNIKGDRNSNPYAVLALRDRQIVVDAGANAVLEVRGGKVKVLAVIPLNGKAQPVPTSITRGPGGDFLVGELAEGAGVGKARVWRIPSAGGTPTVYARGFTAITGVAYRKGTLYVTEFARNFRTEDMRGRVVRVRRNGKRTKLGGKKLMAPTGAAVDSKGAVYVSNFSVLPGTTPPDGEFQGAGGQLVKITP